MSSSIRSAWPQVVGQAWADEEFRRRLFENPRAVFEDMGLEIPAGHNIELLEDTPSSTHLVLPAKPDTLDSLASPVGISSAERSFACTEKPILACTESPIAACTESPIAACTESPIAACTESPIAACTESTPILACTESPIAACTEAPGKKY